jgi:alkylation response protein AidB-like acyl-CoA dehydrogenase
VLSLTVPAALGGQGLGLAASSDVVGRVAQGCPSTALILAMQLTKQAALARNTSYPAALREQIGREAVRDGALFNSIRVEPDLGSPTRGGLPATVARRVADGWRISGRKIYSTGAPGLTWFETFCRTDELRPRVGTFLVRAGNDGLRIQESWNHLGLRASGSHDVVLEDVFVPDAQVGALAVPGEGPPLRDDVQAAWNAALLGALYDGVARAGCDWIVDFLRNRIPSNLGKPLASLPRVQETVGEIEALLAVNDRLIGSIAAQADADRSPNSAESGALKVVLTRNAVEAVRLATSLAGNHGLSRHNGLERCWRDVQCGLVHVPQADSAMVAAGKRILG